MSEFFTSVIKEKLQKMTGNASAEKQIDCDEIMAKVADEGLKETLNKQKAEFEVQRAKWEA